MPTAALKPCAYPGCPTLVKRGYCDAHKRPEISYHDPASQRLYNSKRWLKLRRLQLAAQPFCEDCLRANTYTQATDVDHIRPHHGDPTIFFDRTNLQSLCHADHTRKTNQEQGRGA